MPVEHHLAHQPGPFLVGMALGVLGFVVNGLKYLGVKIVPVLAISLADLSAFLNFVSTIAVAGISIYFYFKVEQAKAAHKIKEIDSSETVVRDTTQSYVPPNKQKA